MDLPSKLLVMGLLSQQYADEWARSLRTFTDEQLLSSARDYIWLAEFGPEAGRDTFDGRRDGIVAEMQTRGMLEELKQLRKDFVGTREQ